MEPLIAQAVVVGDNRPYPTALLTIDTDAAVEWAEHEGRTFEPAGVEAPTTDPDLHAELEAAIERVNAMHSHAEGIRRWRVLPHDFTLADGELTPTLKVKRHVVVERFADLIDEMYAAP
jgi:long-chain acyl-CoA synthetase